MKTKTVLVLSLTVNAVLLGTLAYIQTLSIDPAKTPPIIYIINRSNPDVVGTVFNAASSGETTPR